MSAADPTLEDRVDTGDAVWCYFRLFLFPWQQVNNEERSRAVIMSPGPSIKAATEKLIKILKHTTGAVDADVGGDVEAKATDSGQSGVSAPSFELLKKCHEEWQGLSLIKNYKISQSVWIPGGKRHNTKTKTREEHFHNATQSPWNFFFDALDDETYAVAPFRSINALLELPAEKFGNPQEWMPYMGLCSYTSSPDAPVDVNELCFDGQGSSDHDEDTLVVPELGHVPSLRESLARDID